MPSATGGKSTISGSNDLFWKNVPFDTLPSQGLFYPENSEITIKAATVSEIRQWSTIDDNDMLNEFDIESLVSANIKDHEEPLKGRRNSSTDEYATHIKHKYVGLQDSTPEDGNVHLNWHYSAINNIQNTVELDKMKLIVELATPNPAIYRYLKIPVVMFNFSKTSVGVTEQIAKDAADKGFEKSQPSDNNSADASGEDTIQNDHIQDPFLTGFYVVMGMEYKYSGRGSKITQVLHLARREWPARVNNV